MDAAHLSFLFLAVGHHCLSLFIRRPRWRVGLHRDYGPVGIGGDDHQTHCAYFKYSGRNDWLVSVLESRTFFLEIILAFRVAFHTSGVSRWISAIARGDPKNFDRTRPDFLRNPAHFSAYAIPPTTNPPTLPVALGTGGAIGFLSGLTGTGGGIFLTPALLFFQWAKIRQAAAVSALFILVNSISGLVGYFSAHHAIPSLGIMLAPAVIVCGGLGSHLGSRRFPVRTISLLLATVLIIAGLKLIFTK